MDRDKASFDYKKRVRLLDVTLRDGGYKNKFNFSPIVAASTVQCLHEAGIDFIEIGYRKGSLKLKDGIGPAGLTHDDYISQILTDSPAANLAVMVHPRNIDFHDLESMKDLGVKMVRVCVDLKDLNRTYQMIEKAKSLGLFVSANITRVTYIGVPKTLQLALDCQNRGADVIYIADSNGHMIQAEVKQFISELRGKLEILIGFHPHNNLSLALANSVVAIENGASFIDGSLGGMGRGAGNLATEVFVSYLERTGSNDHYNLVELMKLASAWHKTMMNSNVGISAEELFLGLFNFSADFSAPLLKGAELNNISWYELAHEVSKTKPVSPNILEIERIATDLKIKMKPALNSAMVS